MAKQTSNKGKKEVKKEDTRKVKSTTSKTANSSKTSSKNKAQKSAQTKKVESVKKESKKENKKSTVNKEKQNVRKMENKVSTYEPIPDEDLNMSNVIKMSIIVAVVFLGFYALTIGIQKWQKNKNNTSLSTETNKIQYDEILMSKILKQNSDNYYVLVMDKNDENKKAYTSYINKLQETKVYTADLNSAFNRGFYAEESNVVVENISDLKIKDSTLLHIENHMITEGIEGSSSVLEKIMTLN